MEVREAQNGDELHRGLALVAPADLQARVVRIGSKYTLSCMPGEKVSGHRPSVDALFQSMSEVVQCRHRHAFELWSTSSGPETDSEQSAPARASGLRGGRVEWRSRYADKCR